MGKVAAKRLASQTAQTKAELILGHPIFPGESGVDQLVEIIKVRSSDISVFFLGVFVGYTLGQTMRFWAHQHEKS